MRITSILTIIGFALASSWLGQAMPVRVALSQAGSSQETHVLDSVPEPNAEEIRKIRTAEPAQGDNEKIAKNLEELKRMLRSHKLTVNDLWPSG